MVICSRCLQALPDAARFCLSCGQALQGASETDRERLSRAATATPTPLADKLRAAPLTDERRIVTVLFADVVGSTGMAERLDAEDWKSVMNGAFVPLTAAIHRYEGTIAQFLGDGFLAFFGAPIAHEDDPDRAVSAALDVVAAAAAYSAQVSQRVGCDFAVRIGINTGPTVTGAVGTDLRYEYLAVGDTVNVAARLQAAASPMTVLISDSTRRLLSDGFDLRDLGALEVKGRAQPARAFAVESVPARAVTERRQVARSSPMVGRIDELVRLTATADGVVAGRGAVATIIGEPGIGKSRLLREWRAASDGRGIRWAQVNVSARAVGVAYQVAANVVRSMLGLEPEAGSAELDEALGRLDRGKVLALHRDHLAQLLGIPIGDLTHGGPPLTPQGRQARYVEAVQGLVRAAASKPLCLVLNDVHWADPASVDVLERLLPLHSELPLLLTLLARPDEDTPGWRLIETARRAAGAELTSIRLEPLAADEGDRLIANLLDERALPADLREFVRERAEGNPLFVEETIQMLVEQGLLKRSGGRWEFRADPAGRGIPDTLQGLLAARIDRLEPEARGTLRVASVIGRQFNRGVLERVLGESHALVPELDRLEDAGLIRSAAESPGTEYLFRHALIHDAAYESLLRGQRRQLHRRVGELLEEEEGASADQLAATLAYHFARAEMAAKAAPYQLRAAESAAASYANAAAAAMYRAALDGAEAAGLTRAQVADAGEHLGVVLELTGRFDEAIEAYARASEQLEDGAVLDRARLDRRRAKAHRVARRVPESRAAFEEATRKLDLVPSADRGADWWSERLDLLLERAWLHYFWGPFEEMAAVLDACAPALEQYATDAQRTGYYARLTLLKIRLNHMIVTDDALALAVAAYEAWQATGDPSDVELARFQLGFCHLWRGELATAVRYLEESLSAAELTGDVVLQSRCLIYLAVAARFRGDLEGMERIHARGMPAFTAGGMTEYLSIVAGNRAWAAWRRGDAPSVRQHAEESLRLAATLPTKYAMEWAVRLPLLALELEEGRIHEAIEQARELRGGAFIDEEYGRTLAAATDALEAGDRDEARGRLLELIEQAKQLRRL